MGARFSSLEESAWRWLRQQLTAELGVNFQRYGPQRAVDARTERWICAQLVGLPWGARVEAQGRIADSQGINPRTIRRMLQRAQEVGQEA